MQSVRPSRFFDRRKQLGKQRLERIELPYAADSGAAKVSSRFAPAATAAVSVRELGRPATEPVLASPLLEEIPDFAEQFLVFRGGWQRGWFGSCGRL